MSQTFLLPATLPSSRPLGWLSPSWLSWRLVIVWIYVDPYYQIFSVRQTADAMGRGTREGASRHHVCG